MSDSLVERFRSDVDGATLASALYKVTHARPHVWRAADGARCCSFSSPCVFRAQFGSLFAASFLLSVLFLRQTGFSVNPLQLAASLAGRSEERWPWLAAPRFHLQLAWLLPALYALLALPALLLVLLGVLVAALLSPPLLGLMLIFLLGAPSCLALALLRWSADRWRLTGFVQAMLLAAAAQVVAFQCAAVLLRPYSYFALSATCLAFNLLPLLALLFVASPAVRADPARYGGLVLAALEGGPPVVAADGAASTAAAPAAPLHARSSSPAAGSSHRTGLLQRPLSALSAALPADLLNRMLVLFALSVALLSAYALAVYFLLDAPGSGGARVGDRRGIVVAVCVVVVDLGVAMHSQLSWQATTRLSPFRLPRRSTRAFDRRGARPTRAAPVARAGAGGGPGGGAAAANGFEFSPRRVSFMLAASRCVLVLAGDYWLVGVSIV